LISAQNGDMRSPKRLCTENRNVLVERNSFTSPVKDRLLHLSNLKSKLLPPPLQSAFARYKCDECWSNILCKFALFQFFTTLMLVHLVTVLNVYMPFLAVQQSQIQEVEEKLVQKLGSASFLARYWALRVLLYTHLVLKYDLQAIC